MNTSMQIALLLVAAAILTPNMVLAYGGPGSVISGIGALLAAVVALLASLLGFIWFPLKRLYRSVTEEDEPNDEVVTNQTGE